MDVDALAASSGIALALSIAANIWLARQFVQQLDRNYSMAQTVAELASGLRESLTMWERILRERGRAE